ncbi:MAG: hypothetical protein JWP48_4186 [Actinoallomurus sp.]|nr:hypothetical protein [Actinoallomurus sp.]
MSLPPCSSCEPVGCGYSISVADLAFSVHLRRASVLVDQAAEDFLASEPGLVEVGGSYRPGRLWWSPVSCPMRAMLVVVPFVLGEYATQVAFAVDEKPVGAFAPHGPDPALGDRVRPRSPDRRLDDPHTK